MFKKCVAGAGFVALVTVAWLADSGVSEAGPFARRANRVRAEYYSPDTVTVSSDEATYYPDEGRRRVGRLRRQRMYYNSMPYTYIPVGGDSVTYSTSGYRPGDATKAPAPKTAEMPARLRISIPSEKADVWIEGEKMEQSKRQQEYVSPPLTTGKQYYYEVRARWTDPAGKQVERTKSFPIVPGKPVFLDFTRATSSDKEPIKAPKDEKSDKEK
jgi:uncharacterized protein (TIGR03000 family)